MTIAELNNSWLLLLLLFIELLVIDQGQFEIADALGKEVARRVLDVQLSFLLLYHLGNRWVAAAIHEPTVILFLIGAHGEVIRLDRSVLIESSQSLGLGLQLSRLVEAGLLSHVSIVTHIILSAFDIGRGAMPT